VDLYQQIDGLNAGIYHIIFNTKTNTSNVRLYATCEFVNIEPSDNNTELYVQLFEDGKPLQLHVRGELSPNEYIYVDDFHMTFEGEKVDIDIIQAPMDSLIYKEQVRCYNEYQKSGQLVELKALVKAIRAAKASAEAYAAKEIDKPATEEQIRRFEELLQYAKTRQIGFNAEEYAPYRNIQVMKDAEEAQKYRECGYLAEETVLCYINALAKTNWVVNETEVNAIYNGDFTILENPGRASSPIIAWNIHDVTKPNAKTGPTGASSIMVDLRFEFFGVIGNNNCFPSAARFRFLDTKNYCSTYSRYVYGETPWYEMPLKGSVRDDEGKYVPSTYTFSGRCGVYSSWESSHNFIVDIVDPDDEAIVSQTIETHLPALDTLTHDYKTFDVKFTTVKAGNYKIRIRNADVMDDWDLVLADLSLKSSDASISNENNNVTAIDDINVAASYNKIYTLEGIEVKDESKIRSGIYIKNGKKYIKQ